MLTEVGLRANLKIWDPGPAWNKFFQTEGKATHGFYGTWGYYSTFDADAILHPLYHTEAGGWVGKWYTRVPGLDRSEEHTSELQSHSDLVCRLLLEKKK